MYDTSVRPIIDDWLLQESKKVRDYGNYWSASSAGYCMRKNIFERMGVPHVSVDARKQRVFSSGHIFHNWIQGITKASGASIVQELELQDEEIMVRGHIDDLLMIDDRLMVYDYKTAHSRSFHYSKDRPMSYFHKHQLGTYLYLVRQLQEAAVKPAELDSLPPVEEGRILKISKDDLCMDEHRLEWSDELKDEILTYWTQLNGFWDNKTMPPCTCADHEGGFMAGEKYNPYFYDGEPCSSKYYKLFKEGKLDAIHSN